MNKVTKLIVATVLSVATILSSIFISSLAVSFIGYGRRDSPDLKAWELLSMMVGYVFILSLYGIYLHYKEKKFNDEFNSSRRLDFKNIMISFGVAMLPVLFAVGLSLFFPPVEPSVNSSANQNTNEIINYVGNFALFVSLFYPVIIAPIFEEFLYRGMLGSLFDVFNTKSKFTIALYVGVTSIIFGFLHIQVTGTPYTIAASFLVPFFSGLVYSIQYLKTRNIWYPIISHGMYNLIVIFTTLN